MIPKRDKICQHAPLALKSMKKHLAFKQRTFLFQASYQKKPIEMQKQSVGYKASKTSYLENSNNIL